MKATNSRKTSGSVLKKPSAQKRKHGRSQKQLEDAILQRCAKGCDQLDKQRAFPGISKSRVKPGDTHLPEFPRAWVRWEGSRRTARGTAEWFIPDGVDTRRRMLYLHGGTYVLWAPQDSVYQNLCSRLAKECQVCVLAVDYRLAEEHRFPAAYDDSLAALRWLASHGPESCTDESKATDLFVCGDSAGGGLALAVCMGAGASERNLLRGCVPLSGWMDMTASTPSYDTRKWDAARCFGDAVNPDTDRKSAQEEAEGYLGRGGVKKHGRDWRVSPFFAPASKIRKLPAVLMHVGDYELIRDESVQFRDKMRAVGHTDVSVSVYPRMWHCWHQYSEGGGEKQTLHKAVKAIEEVGRWVRRHIAKKGTT
eukprot:TRINITY_DN33517_c0_g1_i1.p1 TRINITY_DN33517_c0_g1~~TRINITY_DN33517_c0_g1_i1.p1  ORF type:complete len:366 (-),score=50.49 TRINITY_DN33517_c0_g1_i1:79-1176(-)